MKKKRAKVGHSDLLQSTVTREGPGSATAARRPTLQKAGGTSAWRHVMPSGGHGGAEDGLQGLGRQERGAAALTCAFCQRLRVRMHLPPTLHSVGRTRIKKAVGTPNSWAMTHSQK